MFGQWCVYCYQITVEINGENGTKETQTIVIPFTIANPTTAEITSPSIH